MVTERKRTITTQTQSPPGENPKLCWVKAFILLIWRRPLNVLAIPIVDKHTGSFCTGLNKWSPESRKYPLFLMYRLIRSHLWRQEMPTFLHLKPSFWPLLGTGKCPSYSYQIYEVPASNDPQVGKCPLYWIDGAILVSLWRGAKYCVGFAHSSVLFHKSLVITQLMR